LVHCHPQHRARCLKLENTGLRHLSDEIRFEKVTLPKLTRAEDVIE
jgi:hypothetical protein